MAKKNEILGLPAVLIAGIGAVNWALVGFLDFNLVSSLLGGFPLIEKAAYGLVAASGILVVYNYFA